MAKKFGTAIDLGTNRLTNIGLASSSTDGARYDQLGIISAITPTGGTLAITGAISLTGNLALNGGQITTTATGLQHPTLNSFGTPVVATASLTLGGSLTAAATQTGININTGTSVASITNAAVTGLVVGPTITGAGTTPTLTGIQVNPFVATGSPTGTLANLYGINVAAMTLPTGMTAPSSAYGIYVNTPTAGSTNNYAIYTSGTAASSFGGKVTVTSLQINTTSAPTIGYVWTATDTVGNGSWQAGGGGGGITVGTATTGTLTKWASATSLTNSLLAESGTTITLTGGLVVTGTIAVNGGQITGGSGQGGLQLPLYTGIGGVPATTVGLYVRGTVAKAPSSGSNGIYVGNQLTPDTGTNGIGMYVSNAVDATGLTAGYYGIYVQTPTKISGTISSAIGLQIGAQNISDTVNYGIVVSGSANSLQSSSYGISVAGATSSATTATNYGINITSPTAGGAGGTNYGLYVSWPTGAATKYGAYFAGSVAGNYVFIGDGTITATGTFSTGALSVSTTSSSLATSVITLNGATGQTGNLATYSVNAVTQSSIDKDGNFIEPMLTSSALFMEDDFATGALTTTGNIAALNWTSLLGTVALTLQNPVAGHLGIARKSTNNLAIALGTTSCLCLVPSGSYILLPAEMFDTEIICRLNTTANTEFRFALIATPTLTPATTNTGCGIEKLAADTDFFGFCQDGAAKTRTLGITGGPISTTTWYTFRVRRVNGTTIGFNYRAGNGAWGIERTINTNVPTAAMNIAIQISNNNTAAAMTYDIDSFILQVSGITRA